MTMFVWGQTYYVSATLNSNIDLSILTLLNNPEHWQGDWQPPYRLPNP